MRGVLEAAAAHHGVHQRDHRRIAQPAPVGQLALEERRRSPAGTPAARCSAPGTASARSPRPAARRGRRGRPPASAAGTCAPRPGSRPCPGPTSAEITPTSVTRGKSWPLAIICVPTSMSSSPAAKRDSSDVSAPLRRTASRSTRPIRAVRKPRAPGAPRRARCRSPRAPGTAPRTCGRPSAPAPSGCSSGSGRASRCRARCTVSEMLQLGQSNVSPHCRHSTDVA